ncbi:TetR family transcriptional regulator [Brachybacterium vulturis]|uniref:TetR family transcriptional regulator n=1 Tax=Brachybacterium vulturis TaxID=2017484 RepID=A0A291GN38_9MICO|nr:TetR/AcrR family transcriptional regulator [Brachybacterium vulturis]ATG51374.1 TetR family transcriptional regulator [Brachybacterium vulturis]
MDSPDGKGGDGSSTRRRLLVAAAGLIAESGWGRVTTRAVAERAGLPHGTVSYHFRGKQSMLVEAAATAVEEMFPDSELAAMQSVEHLLAWTSAAASEVGACSAQAGVLLEAMRESSRDDRLRERIVEVLRRLRHRVADLVAAEHGQRADPAGPSASAIATVIIAAGDGLWLHSLLDPDLDVSGAVAAMSGLIRPRAEEEAAS